MLFNHCGGPRLVGMSLRELMNMKKHEDEEFSFCTYVGTTMQLLDKEFLRWLLKQCAQPANLSKLIRDAQARKEAGTFGLEYYHAVCVNVCAWLLDHVRGRSAATRPGARCYGPGSDVVAVQGVRIARCSVCASCTNSLISARLHPWLCVCIIKSQELPSPKISCMKMEPAHAILRCS